MSQQLVKKGANGKHENVMPKSWIEAIKDKNTGKTLVEILQSFNMYFLPYDGNSTSTRCLVPTMLRKKGLWITYVKYDGNVYTEWYAADEIDDTSWGDSSNWRIGNNTLVGDITISANGNWVINGTETEFKAVGEKGNTPLIRVANNRLQVSYDLGDTYIDVTDNPVYTKFRWLATTGDTQANNVGRIQASVDEGKTWTNMSNDFTNNLHIKKYIGVNESLPTSDIAEGTIYAKGPYYAEDDTLNDNPIYRLWVYAWKGNTLAWQDNGEFTSIAAGVVQETGNSETEVMSQKAVSTKLSELGSYVNNPNFLIMYVDANGRFLFGIKNNGDAVFGIGVPTKIQNYISRKINELGIGDINSVYDFLGNLIRGDKTLNQLLDDKIDGQYIDNPEFVRVYTDKNGKLIDGFDIKGRKNSVLYPELIICGIDAAPYQIEAARASSARGYGLICSTDEEANVFIRKYKGVNVTFRFFGTIVCAHGIEKYPEHNLIGYGCKLIMGDNLGEDYWNAITLYPSWKTTKIENTEHYWCSHNFTCIKGFVINGNATNNCIVDSEGNKQYIRKGVYGATICFTNYDIYRPENPTSSVVCTSAEVVVEDITTEDTMRGMAFGADVIARNLILGDAYDDHALYIAGSTRSVVENVRIKGEYKSAIAISPQMWRDNERVQNVFIKNVYIDNPKTTALEVRGHFSDWTNNQALNNVFIDGLYINAKNTNYIIMLGTPRDGEVNGTTDYSYNVVIRNAYIKSTIDNVAMRIRGINVNFENCVFDLTWKNAARSMVYLDSKEHIKNAVSFKNCRIKQISEDKTNPWSIFTIDTSFDAVINGLDLDGLTIEGNSNYYLFKAGGSHNNVAYVKNLIVNRLDAAPLGTIDPSYSDYLSLSENDYYKINV